MAIKNIIFDLGGVLLNIDLRKTQDAFTSLGAKNIEEIFRMGHVDSFFKSYETGAINDDEFVAAIQQKIGSEIAPPTLVDAWNALLLDFPPERISLLKDLKKKYRLFLFSNTSALHHVQFHKLYKEEFGDSLDDLFEKAYYSHVAGLHKPDIAAYNLVLDENNLIADETVFIDDSLANVEGANKTGIQGLYLEPGKSILDIDFDTFTWR
ncbi:MAG: HAD family phosphatase [Chitinophagaceae bacterium]|nr:MAG: HAD family phosphatase [Chitinophagaceae bacterium]